MQLNALLFLNILKHRSVQVFLVLFLYLSVASQLPDVVHQAFYTLSMLIKDLLIWVMPLTVGLFIAYAVRSFERRALLFVVTLLVFEGMSNFSSVWYAYGAAHLAAQHLPTLDASTLTNDFVALWRLPLNKPAWWSADKGAAVGLLLGCINAFSRKTMLAAFISGGKNIIEWVLTRIFARLIPLFILGFTAQMYQTDLLGHVCSHYAILVVWLLSFLAIYVVFLFSLGTGPSLKRLITHMKNLLPAWGISLTSSCSLSTMPWTIKGTEKNLDDPEIAQAIIPATTNIQQIGDCIANTFLCFLIYKHFFGVSPDFATWLHFSIIFVLARFATAAVLGGAIFVMLPIYESHLNFNSEMIAIILALNVFLDPIITSTNVIANGALCRVFERLWEHIRPLMAPSPAEVFKVERPK